MCIRGEGIVYNHWNGMVELLTQQKGGQSMHYHNLLTLALMMHLPSPTYQTRLRNVLTDCG